MDADWQGKWLETHQDLVASTVPWTVTNVPKMLLAGPSDVVTMMIIDWLNESVLEDVGLKANVTFTKTGAHTAKSPRRSI